MRNHTAQQYLDLADVIFVALDEKGNITLINRKGCTLLGYQEEELVGRNWFETCLPKADREQTLAVFRQILLGELTVAEFHQNLVVTKDGHERLIDWHNTLVRDESGKIIGTLSSGADVTARSRAERARRDSEAKLRAIVDTAVDGIIIIDERGRIESFNPAAVKLFGYTPDEAIGNNVKMLMPAPHHEKHDTYIRSYIKSGQGKIIGIGREVIGLRKDGSTFPFLLSISEFFVDGSRKFAGFVHDITVRKQAEEALLERESRIRAIVETALDAIITIDDRGVIQSANSAVERLFGYSVDEILGHKINILMPSPYREEHDTYMTNYLQTGIKKIIGLGREVVARRKNGTTFPIKLSVSEFRVSEKRMFAGLIHDLTEQKSLQQRIIQTERLAVIGKMAAKVAHEVRNPLSSISLNAELLEEEILDGQAFDRREASSLLNAIISEIDRVSALTDEYLQFSRLPESEPVEGDLNRLVREVLHLFETEFEQKGITVEEAGLGRKLTVPFDSAQLRRVLINITRNAIESISGRGRLKVWTEMTPQFATIGIKDTGAGIPEDMVPNIFNPFFTTKDFGTGLGLSISQQIIQEHRGQITCQSKVAEGTTFVIQLPIKETK